MDQPLPRRVMYTVSSSRRQTMEKLAVHGEHAVSLTSAILSPHQPDLMIVGTDSGGVLMCNLTPTIRYQSPVEFALSRQMGPIEALDWSRSERNLVLSCGSGTTIQIHNTLQSDLSVNLDLGQGNILAAQFLPDHPSIVLCTTENGTLSVFNLLSESGESNENYESDHGPNLICCVNPSHELRDTMKLTPTPMISLACNHEDYRFVATGDADGRTWIWRFTGLPHLSAAQSKSSVLDRLFARPVE
ncbi:unnamed protein product [Echinostoma caproni]|uniref:WD_REPEATS_REGION domain-containing protein n=1 Tax=Echinostoma caproni TaxID=27848 RepID=A0A183AAL9_9TREM|nr:unnamed protein product [Echinostoma caproni]